MSHLVQRSGLRTCTNPFGSALLCPLFIAGLGLSSKLLSWWKWAGTYAGCSKPVKEMEGIFCGNFSASRNGLPPCGSTWHAGCYMYRGSTKFPMPAMIVDEEGNLWHKEEERQQQLMEGVDGSHLCSRVGSGTLRDEIRFLGGTISITRASGGQTWMQCWASLR